MTDAHAGLKLLENEKQVEAERATVMMLKCQDEVGKLVGKHAKKSPLHKALNNAKDNVKKYVGEYLKLTQGTVKYVVHPKDATVNTVDCNPSGNQTCVFQNWIWCARPFSRPLRRTL